MHARKKQMPLSGPLTYLSSAQYREAELFTVLEPDMGNFMAMAMSELLSKNYDAKTRSSVFNDDVLEDLLSEIRLIVYSTAVSLRDRYPNDGPEARKKRLLGSIKEACRTQVARIFFSRLTMMKPCNGGDTSVIDLCDDPTHALLYDNDIENRTATCLSSDHIQGTECSVENDIISVCNDLVGLLSTPEAYIGNNDPAVAIEVSEAARVELNNKNKLLGTLKSILPSHLYSIASYRILDNMCPKEIAELKGCTVNNVYHHLGRLKDQLLLLAEQNGVSEDKLADLR